MDGEALLSYRKRLLKTMQKHSPTWKDIDVNSFVDSAAFDVMEKQVYGDADKAVPVARSRSMIAAVRAAGGRPIYSELPGVGHDSWTPAYRDRFVLDWLFGQRR